MTVGIVEAFEMINIEQMSDEWILVACATHQSFPADLVQRLFLSPVNYISGA